MIRVPTIFSVCSLAAVMLIGGCCTCDHEFEDLSSSIERQVQRAEDLERTISSLDEGLQARRAEIERLATQCTGIRAELQEGIESTQVQLAGVGEVVDRAVRDSAEARGAAAQVADDLAQSARDAEVQHAALRKALEDTGVSFQRYLDGTKREFQANVDALGTRLTGVESKLSATVDKKILEMVATTKESETLLTGRIEECRSDVEAVRRENEGFSKELEDALEKLKVVDLGLRSFVEESARSVAARCTGTESKVDELEARLTHQRASIATMIEGLKQLIISLDRDNGG